MQKAKCKMQNESTEPADWAVNPPVESGAVGTSIACPPSPPGTRQQATGNRQQGTGDAAQAVSPQNLPCSQGRGTGLKAGGGVVPISDPCGSSGTPAPARTLSLIARSQAGDRTALDQLVAENLGLIRAVARRYQGRGVENDDLFQLASLGFLKAAAGFDPAFGTQFSTYAVPKIAGEIRRFLRDDGAVKVSRTLKERAAAVRQARDRLAKTLGREPVLSELAEALDLSPEEIAEAETAADPVASIQQPSGDTGLTLEAVLSDGPMEEQIVERLALRQALDRLPEREARVLALRYYHALTQDRTAKLVGVSQVQVSRIEKKALAHLRELLE